MTLRIQKAFTAPQTTYPSNPDKGVPGNSADQPLHRLYYDSARRAANRNSAGDVCEADDPNYDTAGLGCDEYPFAEIGGPTQHFPRISVVWTVLTALATATALTAWIAWLWPCMEAKNGYVMILSQSGRLR